MIEGDPASSLHSSMNKGGLAMAAMVGLHLWVVQLPFVQLKGTVLQ